MASPRSIVVLAAAGLLLPLIFVPFSTSASPTTPESETDTTVSKPSPSHMTRKQITDIVFSFLFFMFFMGIFAWIGRCFSFPTPGVAADRLRVTYRAFVETVSRFRLGTLIRKAANAMVGAYNARAPSPRDGGDTAPSTHATSPQSLEQLEDQRPGGIAATHDGASSAGIHHHQACLASA